MPSSPGAGARHRDDQLHPPRHRRKLQRGLLVLAVAPPWGVIGPPSPVVFWFLPAGVWDAGFARSISAFFRKNRFSNRKESELRWPPS